MEVTGVHAFDVGTGHRRGCQPRPASICGERRERLTTIGGLLVQVPEGSQPISYLIFIYFLDSREVVPLLDVVEDFLKDVGDVFGHVLELGMTNAFLEPSHELGGEFDDVDAFRLAHFLVQAIRASKAYWCGRVAGSVSKWPRRARDHRKIRKIQIRSSRTGFRSPVIDSARTRILIIVLLLAGQAALFPLYAQQPVNEDAWVLSGASVAIESPDRHLGQRVTTGGIVVDPSPLVIRVETDTGTHRISITDSGLDPERGDKVRVYGVVTGDRTIRAIHAFVVPRRGLWYTWTVSFIAGLWVLTRLIRHWTIDLATLSFRPRRTPLSIQALVHSHGPWGGEGDA